MKNAFELVALAVVSNERNITLEEIRKQKEEIEKNNRTIIFCEEIGNELEELANNGLMPTYYFYTDNIGCVLKSTNRAYSDKRTSYYSNTEAYSFKKIKEYFEDYDFEVKFKNFEYWQHGFGKRNGYSISISPKFIK